MRHPSVDELLADGAEARAHLDACLACRRLVGVVAGAAAPPAHVRDLDELPTVDREIYTDVSELPGGVGGMGRVLRARDRRLGRDVVIKVPRGTADAALRARLEREARLTARLQHPSIVTVYEAGRFADGEPFYAMPLVRGVPLADAIAERRSVAERLALLSHVSALSDAVAYAHGRGVVHRDIKPDNVLIGSFGETVLIDWGLAKDLGDVSDEAAAAAEREGTLTRMGVGTACYMPPEQARGAPPDPRMDVYALGATLYHLLAGRPPYDAGDAASTRARLLAGPPEPLSALVPDAPAPLVDIVARAMARNATARFASAEALAAELHRFQTGQLVESRRYSARELLARWMRRHRTALRVSVVAALALVAVAAVAVARIVRERDRARAESARAERNERHALDELAVSRGMSASRLALDPARRLDALELGVRAVAPAVARGDAPALAALQGLYDAIVAVPVSRRLDELRGGVTGAAVTRDGSRLAVASAEERRLALWDLRRATPVAAIASQLENPFFVVFSPDERRLLTFGFSPDAELWEPASGRVVRLATRDQVGRAAGFLPDGRVVTAADALVVWDANGNEVEHAPLPRPGTRLAVSPRGLVAVATVDGGVLLHDPASGRTRALAGHTGTSFDVAFSPDGSLVASTAADGRLLLESADLDGSAAPRVLADDPAHAIERIGFFADGRRLCAWRPPAPDDSGNLRIIGLDGQVLERFTGYASCDAPFLADRMPGSTTEELQLFDAARGGVLAAAPAAVGQVAAIVPVPGLGAFTALQQGDARVWDLRDGAATGMLLGHTEEVVALAARGDRVLSASLDGTAIVWDAASGAAQARVAVDTEILGAVWAPDADRFALATIDGVALVYAADGRPLAALGTAGEPTAALAFAPDGERLLVARGDGAVLYEVAGGAGRDFAAGTPEVTALAWSGGWLATGHLDGSIRVWRADGTLTAMRSADGGAPVASLAFVGDRLVVGFTSGAGLLADPERLEDGTPLDARPADAGAPLSPDGRTLALVTADGLVVLRELAGGAERRLAGATRMVTAIAWSPDGARLAVGSIDGTVRLWEVATGTPVLTLPSPQPVTQVAWSADGRALLFGDDHGDLRLFPATAEGALARACGLLDALGRSCAALGPAAGVTAESARSP